MNEPRPTQEEPTHDVPVYPEHDAPADRVADSDPDSDAGRTPAKPQKENVVFDENREVR